jgi:chorismate mutase
MQSYNEWSNNLLDFLEKRLEGAKKVAEQARSKGGYAKLTAWHFEAKLPEYEKLIELAKDKSDKEVKNKARTEFNNYVNKVRSASSEKAFQEISGKLEVYGEVLRF